MPLYRPAGHSVTADAPSPQYPPAVPQCMQSVAPPLDWYVPAPHLVHAPCPPKLLKVPVLHAVSAVLPMLQYVPAKQLEHPDSADNPAALLYRPAGHSVIEDAPTSQYPPVSMDSLSRRLPAVPAPQQTGQLRISSIFARAL